MPFPKALVTVLLLSGYQNGSKRQVSMHNKATTSGSKGWFNDYH